MADDSMMKHGKLAPKIDQRTLKLAKYLMPDLPPPPVSVDWASAVTEQWGMMENDRYENCTCAAAGHLIMAWTALAKDFQPVAARQVVAAYAALTGLDPETGANDNGAKALDVLNYWRKTGIAGHVIDSYVALTPDNNDHVRIAVHLFVGTYIGLALPISAQTQDVWDVPAGGASGSGAVGSWEGHAVCVVGYDTSKLTVITWGKKKQMTWEFLQTYCDEAYAILSKDYLIDGTAPQGIDEATLRQDLEAIQLQPAGA